MGTADIRYCNVKLRRKDLPYPRTCSQCGLGPCPWGVAEPSSKEAEVNDLQAFPVSEGIDRAPTYGMTLRDYFAAHAMGIVPNQNATNMRPNESGADYIARRSYEYADAMLKARG